MCHAATFRYTTEVEELLWLATHGGDGDCVLVGYRRPLCGVATLPMQTGYVQMPDRSPERAPVDRCSYLLQ